MARDEHELWPRGDTAAPPAAEHAAAQEAGDEHAGADQRDVLLPVSVEKIVTRDLPHEEDQEHEEI